MQVPERDVAEPVEDARGHVADAADGYVPLGGAGLPFRGLRALMLVPPAGDPRVREYDGAGRTASRGIGPDKAKRGTQNGCVAARGRRPLRVLRGGLLLAIVWQAKGRRLQVGHAVHGDLAAGVGEQHRLGERGGPGPQVHAGGVDERAVDAEPAGGVVVAADQDHPGAGRAQPGERVLVKRHRVNRRDGPVVDVARHEHGVHPRGPRRLDEVVEERGLCLPQVETVQRPPEVPVRGMQEPHGKDGSDSLRHSAGDSPPDVSAASASRSSSRRTRRATLSGTGPGPTADVRARRPLRPVLPNVPAGVTARSACAVEMSAQLLFRCTNFHGNGNHPRSTRRNGRTRFCHGLTVRPARSLAVRKQFPFAVIGHLIMMVTWNWHSAAAIMS